jgi:hypothetical protein
MFDIMFEICGCVDPDPSVGIDECFGSIRGGIGSTILNVEEEIGCD